MQRKFRIFAFGVQHELVGRGQRLQRDVFGLPAFGAAAQERGEAVDVAGGEFVFERLHWRAVAAVLDGVADKVVTVVRERGRVAKRGGIHPFAFAAVAAGAFFLVKLAATSDVAVHGVGGERCALDAGLLEQPVGEVPGFIERHRAAGFIEVATHGGALPAVLDGPQHRMRNAGFKQRFAAQRRRMVIDITLPVFTVAEHAVFFVIGSGALALLGREGADGRQAAVLGGVCGEWRCGEEREQKECVRCSKTLAGHGESFLG